MPRPDAHHEAVRNALIKDGWTITHDPFIIRLEDVKFYIDLAAEKEDKVAVEIKVFGGASFLNEFEKAVGQYLIYRQFLNRLFSERTLFLAVSVIVFEESFVLPTIRAVIEEQRIKLLIFDSQSEEIVKWIN